MPVCMCILYELFGTAKLAFFVHVCCACVWYQGFKKERVIKLQQALVEGSSSDLTGTGASAVAAKKRAPKKAPPPTKR